MRRWIVAGWVLLVFLAVLPPTQAELESKTYVFRRGVTLEVGSDLQEGLRLESVRFFAPQGLGSRILRPSGTVKAEITMSNLGSEAQRVGIALALFDDQDRLLAVASGGSSLLALKPERQTKYSLVFEDVKLEAMDAATFKISVETKL